MNSCADCGCEIRPVSTRCRTCAGLMRRAPRSHHSGYARVFRPGHPLARKDGYVALHRFVVYEAGVDVPPGYHVHHKNGNRSDNRLTNLEVISASAHSRHHVGATATNQYGTFPVLREPEARRAREAAKRARKRGRDWSPWAVHGKCGV
jgi:hypothetical protein